jgi:thiamine-phosphate pyrophosphorylase
VTDRRALGPADPEAIARVLECIKCAARAGVDAAQIREKDLSGRALLELATAARQTAGSIKVIVNDRLDVALACSAAGVHLGSNSLPVAEVARFRAGGRTPAEFLIGRSCHSLEDARAAEGDGADYLFFGPVFATPSKAAFGPPQGVDKLAAVCREAKIPVFAIGGITLENAAACLRTGAAGVAAIRMFQDAADVEAVVQELRRK